MSSPLFGVVCTTMRNWHFIHLLMLNLSNRWHVLVTPPLSHALLVPDKEQMVVMRKKDGVRRERKREKRQYLLGQDTCVVCGSLRR